MTPITLRCTKKLTKLLGVRESLLAEPSRIAERSEWYANLLWMDGRKCLLVTQAHTLFSFFVPDVRKADLTPIGSWLVDHIQFELATEELPVDTFGRLDPRNVSIARTESRSVLGSMKELAFLCEDTVQRSGGLALTNTAELNLHLRRFLLSAIGSETTGRNYGQAIDVVRDSAIRKNS